MAAPARLSAAVCSQGADCSSWPGLPSGGFSRRHATAYRARFAHRWQAFLHQHFEGPEHVAFAFGVEGSTARKWWEGSHAPSGFAVGLAFALMPAAAGAALGRAA